MRFCPKCGKLLMPAKRKSGLYLVCRRCSYSEADSQAAQAAGSFTIKGVLSETFGSIYESAEPAAEPGAYTVEFECKRCGRRTSAIRGTIQARKKLCMDCYRESRQGEIAFRDTY